MASIILQICASLAQAACPSPKTGSEVLQNEGTVTGCATLALWRHRGGPNQCATPRTPPPPPSRADEKQVRDPFGGAPLTRETTHFVIKWGQFDDFSNSEIDMLAEALETSWSHEIDGLEYPAPKGSETFKVNVYIGNTLDDGPTINPSA